jgi:hypothetical protein
MTWVASLKTHVAGSKDPPYNSVAGSKDPAYNSAHL